MLFLLLVLFCMFQGPELRDADLVIGGAAERRAREREDLRAPPLFAQSAVLDEDAKISFIEERRLFGKRKGQAQSDELRGGDDNGAEFRGLIFLLRSTGRRVLFEGVDEAGIAEIIADARGLEL